MRDKYPQILRALASTKAPVFIAAILVFTAAILVASLRLKLIIEAQEIPITLKESVSLTFIGYFFNNFLPTSIGGDVVNVSHGRGGPSYLTHFWNLFLASSCGIPCPCSI